MSKEQMVTYFEITAFGVERYAKTPEEAYEKILGLTEDEMVAKEVCLWCSLATVGDVYRHKQDVFKVTVIEDVE